MYYCDMEAECFLNYKEEFFMMLRFRKMMAVLLAAALTLTMLTACGGGGSGASVDAKVKLTNDINSILPEGYPKVKYDKELDEEAEYFHDKYPSRLLLEDICSFDKLHCSFKSAIFPCIFLVFAN